MLDRIALAVLASVLLLTACGGSNSTPATPTAPTTTASCSAAVTQDPATKTLAAAATTFTVTVTTGAGCSWTAVANDSFLSITAGASGTGSGTVQVAVSANGGADRTGTLTIAGTTVTVTQTGAAAGACAFSVTPTSASIPASGGDLTFTVAVTQGANCSWTAATSDPSLSIKSGASGTGNGTVVLTAAANTGGNRTATATIAGQAVTISQPAAGCAFTVSASSTSVPTGGGDVTLAISMTQGVGCTWTVASTDAFVTIKNGASGTGSGTAVVTLAANTGASRTASISVAGQTIVISQAGGSSGGGTVACAFTVTASPASVPASGGDVQLIVTNTQGTGCGWTASVSSAFVTIVSGATGTGSGTAVARFFPNTSTARSVTISIAGQMVVVSQAAASCAFIVSPGNQSVSAAVQVVTETVTLTAGVGCSWTATTTAPFLTILSGGTGTGSGTVSIQVAANVDAARSGSVTIAGQTFSITQNDGRGTVVILSLQSQQYEPLLHGKSQTITSPATAMQTVAVNASHSEVDLVSSLTGTPSWSLYLASASGGTLSPGYFDDTARWPFQPATQPGLDMSFGGAGCNNSSGRFVVAEATFSGTTIQRFHAVFEQHCEYSSAALIGDIWIDAGGSTSVPPLSLPPPPASPTTFFHAQTASGDPVGNILPVSYTLSTAVVTPSFDPRAQHVSVGVGGASFSWNFDFAAPSGQVLVPGTYSNATQWPLPTPGTPGLALSGYPVGCSPMSTGQFTVLEIQYDASNAIQRFHATFAMTCAAGAALTGEIYVVANPWR